MFNGVNGKKQVESLSERDKRRQKLVNDDRPGEVPVYARVQAAGNRISNDSFLKKWNSIIY